MAKKKLGNKKPLIHINKNKKCVFCEEKKMPVWQDYDSFREFLSPRSTILNAKMNGTCMKHQRRLANVIKQARHLGLLPFVTQE
jgi:small subunit ribosomal protein S18